MIRTHSAIDSTETAVRRPESLFSLPACILVSKYKARKTRYPNFSL